jgi:quercetin dioxygenase-like cupin family protein
MTKRAQPALPEIVREAGLGDDVALREALTRLTPAAKAPPQLLRERLLATVARPRLRFAPLFGALAELFDLGDGDLAEIFERAAAADAWVASQIPGTELMHLAGGPRVLDADNGLVRLRPGARFPAHRHLGLERVLVLEGGYRDEPSGRVYAAGELHEMTSGSSHSLVALPERDLLFAVSLVTGVDVEGFGTLSGSEGLAASARPSSS